MIKTNKITKVWLDREATAWEYRESASRTGKRIVVMRYSDDGTYKIKACKGDGRTPRFEVYWERDNLTISEDEIDAMAPYWLEVAEVASWATA
jgi:hypothetical protein